VKLKLYQAETLAILRRFLEEARLAGPEAAYGEITREDEQAGRLGRYRGSYRPLAGLPDVPYVCLRLPTGGGKTILAAHTVAVARDAWIERGWPMALWLVPTKTIRRQTAEALKDPAHPYRQALDEAFDGRVRVFDIADFTHIRPHDLRDYCCIVVGTIQTLRVRTTEGRKVYAHNENLETHFSRIAGSPEGLETLADGSPKFSFANLMHLHRPLLVVDEAHNAVTGLTREMQARLNPCAIVEFTATPREKSNILHSVTARELKAEEMIKLPVMLSEHDSWQNAVSSAVQMRASLAADASGEPDLIRPIALFQAQPRNQEVTVAALKQHLIEVERVPEERIAVATGVQRELDGIDLFDPACRIEHVITVEALKEGWDCSFAYAFCSVCRIRSATDVEQLLGRVLRMPYARKREKDSLNRAYAFFSEPVAGEAARALVDKLVKKMGFDEEEAWGSIEPVQGELDRNGELFAPAAPDTSLTFNHIVDVSDAELSRLVGGQNGYSVRETEPGKAKIVVVGDIGPELEKQIQKAAPRRAWPSLRRGIATHRLRVEKLRSPAQRGEIFAVPRLMSVVQGRMDFADTELFLESHDWSLLDHSAALSGSEFAIREIARSFEIDLDGRRLTYRQTSVEEQLALDVDVEGWTDAALILWLDRRVRQRDIGQGELIHWLSELVGHLTGSRGMSIGALMRCKFILARKVSAKIAEIRKSERERVYERFLFEPGAKVEVSFDHAFEFRDGMYEGQRVYRGRWRANRHFLGPDRIPAFDGAPDGEEFQCAQAIDNLGGVQFWVRNVAKHTESFWLPTATGKFYPDFVARLEDGRLLVVEYKGAHMLEDAREKRAVGELWERSSGGRGLFLIAEKSVQGKDVASQIREKMER
jgi:type III restriction enzyme